MISSRSSPKGEKEKGAPTILSISFTEGIRPREVPCVLHIRFSFRKQNLWFKREVLIRPKAASSEGDEETSHKVLPCLAAFHP